MISVSTFFKIPLKDNSIVILDIDDTILQYKEISTSYWTELYEHYYNIHNDINIANKLTSNDWIENVKLNLPVHTDRDGFFDLLTRATNQHCKVVCVTARDKSSKDITHKHLNLLDIFDIDVYFAENDKSIVINDIINNEDKEYSSLIFVDDRESNLDNVNNFFGEMVICYKFEILN